MNLPIDPDLESAAGATERAGSSPFEHGRFARRPRLRADVLLVIFVGGSLGGWARYGIGSTWPTDAGRFPWATLTVNVSGAFILALVIVAAADIVSSRYLRPLLGTGFCGAFTTFSSIVVTTDLLFAHDHPGTAVTYLAASIVAGLAAALLGLVLGRAVAANRRRAREKGSPS
ncbi:MAG TPA: CrcB family protein [Jatrophihabitantaceae bacterium]|nr:CrcB family protein [Jatrophihabitantaceae bacterium]